MGRWRPPPPSSSAYITPAGFSALQQELDDTWHRRRDVVKALAEAAAEGDRSENAEYIYGKKKMREIDKRLKYLGQLLKDVDVIEPSQLRGNKVVVGATVEVEDEAGDKKRWTIVGDGEADAREGTISYKAPVAKALIGKEAGEIVTIVRPKGEMEVEITALYFGDRLIAEA